MERLFVITWIILHVIAARAEDVCREVEGVAVTSCDDGFYCCANDRKCCSSAALGVPAIVAIVIGCVLFIAIVIAFVLLCRKPPPRKTIDNDNHAQEIEMVCRASLELPPPYILDAYKLSPLPASFPLQPPPYELEPSTDPKDICDKSSIPVDSFQTLPAERFGTSCDSIPEEILSSKNPPSYTEAKCTATIEQQCTATIEQACTAVIEQKCTASIDEARTKNIEQARIANREIMTHGEEQGRTEESLHVQNDLGLPIQEATVYVSNTTSGEIGNVSVHVNSDADIP